MSSLYLIPPWAPIAIFFGLLVFFILIGFAAGWRRSLYWGTANFVLFILGWILIAAFSGVILSQLAKIGALSSFLTDDTIPVLKPTFAKVAGFVMFLLMLIIGNLLIALPLYFFPFKRILGISRKKRRAFKANPQLNTSRYRWTSRIVGAVSLPLFMLPVLSALSNTSQAAAVDYHVIGAAMRKDINGDPQNPNYAYNAAGEIAATNAEGVTQYFNPNNVPDEFTKIELFNGDAPTLTKSDASTLAGINKIDGTFSYWLDLCGISTIANGALNAMEHKVTTAEGEKSLLDAFMNSVTGVFNSDALSAITDSLDPKTITLQQIYDLYDGIAKGNASTKNKPLIDFTSINNLYPQAATYIQMLLSNKDINEAIDELAIPMMEKFGLKPFDISEMLSGFEGLPTIIDAVMRNDDSGSYKVLDKDGVKDWFNTLNCKIEVTHYIPDGSTTPEPLPGGGYTKSIYEMLGSTEFSQIKTLIDNMHDRAVLDSPTATLAFLELPEQFDIFKSLEFPGGADVGSPSFGLDTKEDGFVFYNSRGEVAKLDPDTKTWEDVCINKNKGSEPLRINVPLPIPMNSSLNFSSLQKYGIMPSLKETVTKLFDHMLVCGDMEDTVDLVMNQLLNSLFTTTGADGAWSLSDI